jgi:hypothetical protein
MIGKSRYTIPECILERTNSETLVHMYITDYDHIVKIVRITSLSESNLF